MKASRLDPYLWVHLAGAAAVPLWLDICLLGLAVGNPIMPMPLELGLIGIVGSLPVLWMQWKKPFCIYSLLFLALAPDQLSEDQRRVLRVFKSPVTKFVAGLVPVFLLWVLQQLYLLAPAASQVTPLASQGRVVGLLVAAFSFLMVNLFVQVPVSVVLALLTPERKLAQGLPYEAHRISTDFTLLGLRVKRLLPDLKTSSEGSAQQSNLPLHEDKESVAVSESASASVAEPVLNHVELEAEQVEPEHHSLETHYLDDLDDDQSESKHHPEVEDAGAEAVAISLPKLDQGSVGEDAPVHAEEALHQEADQPIPIASESMAETSSLAAQNGTRSGDIL